jgi:hypothetical protein
MITFYWTMIDDRTSKKGISGICLLLNLKFSPADFISSREVPQGSPSGLSGRTLESSLAEAFHSVFPSQTRQCLLSNTASRSPCTFGNRGIISPRSPGQSSYRRRQLNEVCSYCSVVGYSDGEMGRARGWHCSPRSVSQSMNVFRCRDRACCFAWG